MNLKIGFRVRSKRGTQFRKWANRNLKEYMILVWKKTFKFSPSKITKYSKKNTYICPDK